MHFTLTPVEIQRLKWAILLLLGLALIWRGILELREAAAQQPPRLVVVLPDPSGTEHAVKSL